MRLEDVRAAIRAGAGTEPKAGSSARELWLLEREACSTARELREQHLLEQNLRRTSHLQYLAFVIVTTAHIV